MNRPATVARAVTRPVEQLAAGAAMRLTAHTPFAASVRAGISAEGRIRRILDQYHDRLSETYGFATRIEVEHLRELVRAMEYRLEQVESAHNKAGQSQA